jgi:hypothetical protein
MKMKNYFIPYFTESGNNFKFLRFKIKKFKFPSIHIEESPDKKLILFPFQ